jgi:hypothetical protein
MTIRHLTFLGKRCYYRVEVFTFMKMNYGLALGAVLGLAAAQVASADPTALDLVKKGDNYVGVQSKDKILQINSEKSVASLTPNIWHVVYYDPDTFFKSTDVKFGAGQEMDVSHPMHPFQFPAKPDQIMDLPKITVDSDRALEIASSQPLLKGLTLRASKLTLQMVDGIPTWKVELWTAKVSDATKDANVGTVSISAVDRSVLNVDLHPDNAS